MVTGKIQKIYSVDGTRIHNIEEIKNAQYVLVANDDPFIKTRYNILAIKPTTGQRGLQGATLHNEYIHKIRPITKRKSRRPKVETLEQSASEAPRATTSQKSRKSYTKKIVNEENDEPESEIEKEVEVIKPVRVQPKKVSTPTHKGTYFCNNSPC